MVSTVPDWLLAIDPTANGNGTIERWGALVALILAVITLVGVMWRKVLVPLVRGMDWLRDEMKANGVARVAGTNDLSLRDALDVNTADTRNLMRLVENVRTRTEERHEENVEALAAVAERFDAHIAWSDDVVASTETRHAELATMVAALAMRMSELERRDTRPPRLEPEDE